MAFLITVRLNNGIEITNSYARISYISGNKERLEITLDYYSSRENFLNGSSPVQSELYGFKPNVNDDADNFYKQGYDQLKILDKFKGAIFI